MIKDGSVVTLHYTLKVDDDVVDSSVGQEPLSYVHGRNEIIAGLEEQLEGLDAGGKATAVVAPEKGYGPRDPSNVQEVPRAAFQNADKLSVGDVVVGQVGERRFQATVAEVQSEAIRLDMNHPLAGKTLHFDVEILGVD